MPKSAHLVWADSMAFHDPSFWAIMDLFSGLFGSIRRVLGLSGPIFGGFLGHFQGFWAYLGGF